ncbi:MULTISPECIES: hypothetical protein [Cyanophyceae]|uniref:hypothetical protein n=1 Tax=Cyanophyceae TaxID=3028117 RepID=UPI001689A380|nr:hypothetical protein [Trichocoleus sp. FACHB-40]MBD2005176.1 hypothetical protein [Trichocoleus sp. FACHB-40]
MPTKRFNGGHFLPSPVKVSTNEFFCYGRFDYPCSVVYEIVAIALDRANSLHLVQLVQRFYLVGAKCPYT